MLLLHDTEYNMQQGTPHVNIKTWIRLGSFAIIIKLWLFWDFFLNYLSSSLEFDCDLINLLLCYLFRAMLPSTIADD